MERFIPKGEVSRSVPDRGGNNPRITPVREIFTNEHIPLERIKSSRGKLLVSSKASFTK